MGPSAPHTVEADVNILIAHDLLALLGALRNLVESVDGNQVVGVVRKPEDVPTGNHADVPDALLIGAGTQSNLFDSESIIQEAQEQYPGISVVVMFRGAIDHHLHRFVRLQVDGYVSEEGPQEHTLEALSTVGAGMVYVCPELSPKYKSVLCGHLDQVSSSTINPLASLTKHQARILHRLGEGQTYKEIAFELDCKASTVETHCRRLRKKLQVDTLSELRNFQPGDEWVQ